MQLHNGDNVPGLSSSPSCTSHTRTDVTTPSFHKYDFRFVSKAKKLVPTVDDLVPSP